MGTSARRCFVHVGRPKSGTVPGPTVEEVLRRERRVAESRPVESIGASGRRRLRSPR